MAKVSINPHFCDSVFSHHTSINRLLGSITLSVKFGDVIDWTGSERIFWILNPAIDPNEFTITNTQKSNGILSIFCTRCSKQILIYNRKQRILISKERNGVPSPATY
ncbi:hypothetical protein ADT26_14380 [Xanthomonas oryzae]|nr:hypothetical protein ADT26_14380 [Xanthomonas oryzae]